ncbi:hypothetical protein BUE80_DR003807 [Diplocarpon rosae]|nr:hypothetical protein BUE80_DR003807 [Diplocarpon rosae]
MRGLHIWVLPIVSGTAWFIILVTLMIYWQAKDRPIYPSMEPGQSIAYISDIGAKQLKPLFVLCAALTTVSFNASIVAETWLRHWGGPEHHYTQAERRLSIASIVFGALAGYGLVCLSIFDTQAYPRVHNLCLFTFMGTFVASAICNCWEHGILASRGQEYRTFRNTFGMKLVFILLELGLASAFVATWHTRYYNAAAVLEWNLAVIFGIHHRHGSTQLCKSQLEDI